MLVMYISGKAAFYDKRNKQIYICISVIIFTLFAAVRYDVGVDYFSYLNEYDRLLIGLQPTRDYETGFHILSLILSDLHLGPTFYFGLWAILQISLLYIALSNFDEVKPYLGITLICFGTYFMWMNGIRQSIALMFFLLGISYASHKEVYKFLICIVCGYLFHKSILLLLPLYFLFASNKELFPNIKIQLALVFTCLIISNTGIMSLISSYINDFAIFIGYGEELDYEEIINSQLESNRLGWGPRRIIMLLINLITIVFSSETKKYYNNSFYIALYNTFILGVIIEMLFFESHIVMRLFYYFTGLYFILHACLLNYLLKNKKIMGVIYLGLFIIVFYANIYAAYLVDGGHLLYNFIPSINI